MGLFGRKKESILVQERIKPDAWEVVPAKLGISANPGEPMIFLRDGRKFIVPEERKGEYVRVTMPKRIRKGIQKMFLIETGQVVRPPANLTAEVSPVLDNQTVAGVQNRASARRLANPKLPTNQLYIWLLMGAIVGISIGWILYPQFNHPPPIIEYCTRLLNGTVLPRSCPGG